VRVRWARLLVGFLTEGTSERGQGTKFLKPRGGSGERMGRNFVAVATEGQ
jgi:hypothetical protein